MLLWCHLSIDAALPQEKFNGDLRLHLPLGVPGQHFPPSLFTPYLSVDLPLEGEEEEEAEKRQQLD